MDINIAVVISALAFGFAIYQGLSNMKRNQIIDDKSAASEMTTVIVKLENIGNGVSDIKNEINDLKESVKEDHERIIKLETYCSLHGMKKDQLECK